MTYINQKKVNVLPNINNKINIDLTFLKKLYFINSKSGSEDDITLFIINILEKLYPDVTYELDTKGSLYLTKGTLDEGEFYPCLIAHLDEVHAPNISRHILEYDNYVFGFDVTKGETCGIGADDKNGIAIALAILKLVDKVKVFLPVGEETGCVGSNAADVTFFNDVAYMLQCDRRGNTDLITKTNGIEVTSDDFLADVKDIMTDYGYSTNTGTSTDVGALKKKDINVSGCNISCGYFNEHTGSEITHIPSLNNCLNFVHKMILKCGYKRYDHIHKSIYAYSTYPSTKTYNSAYSEYDEEGIYGYGYGKKGYKQNFPKVGETKTEGKQTSLFDNKKTKNKKKIVADITEICTTCSQRDCMRCPHFKNN